MGLLQRLSNILRMPAIRLSTRPSSLLHFTRNFSINHDVLKYSEEVQQAKLEGQPIVALESTIISHGMPYPQNLETAVAVEKIIRKQGAVPATVAILKGQLTVGLSAQQLTVLAQSKAVKTSRRDFAYVVANGLDGATTVAGTIVAAELAGIPVFATGGLGGVHREGQKTMDISADLTELGRCSTCVVCSGVKSILDIPRTLEYLETQGVCVGAFGDSNAFPAFYTRRSGHRAPYRIPDAAHAARLLQAAHALQLRSGVLVAVPVPQDHAMDEDTIKEAIEKALDDAERCGVRGKEITPFLLAAVAEMTKGASLDTNIALIKNNAKVGAEIAVEYWKLKNEENTKDYSKSPNAKCSGISAIQNYPQGISKNFSRSLHSHDNGGKGGGKTIEKFDELQNGPVVIGGANVDRTFRLVDVDLKENRH